MDAHLTTQAHISEKKRLRGTDAVFPAKKLRSNIPRRKRIPSFPVGVSLKGYFRLEDEAESSSSCFNSEITNSVSVEFTRQRKWPGSSSDVWVSKSIRNSHSSGDYSRPITRLYSKRQKEFRSQECVGKLDLGVGTFSHSASVAKNSGATQGDENTIAISGVSDMSSLLPEQNPETRDASSKALVKRSDLSESSCLQPIALASDANEVTMEGIIAAETSGIQFKSETVTRGEEALDHDLESDLACPEQLLCDEKSSEYSACNEQGISEFESDLFDGFYEGDSSEVSFSDLIESPDDFSERSRDNCTPSVAFTLLQQLYEEFNPSSFHSGTNSKFDVPEELSDDFVFVRFPDKDDEESYQIFRGSERNEIALHDYTYGYRTTTEFGDLITGQRLEMVHWMMEHCHIREHHDETLFLGVNLMDRFLSRGYFQTKRNLQLLGIACVTLATRIEENQPYNCVRKKSFKVEDNLYKRCEVVSMEWLVLEVLSFQCSLPTTYSFLWFYMKAARASAEVEDLCRYLAILTLFNPDILRFWPSTVAAGIVILASLAANNDSNCDVVLETHLRSKTDDLPECIQSLEWLVKHATLRSRNGS